FLFQAEDGIRDRTVTGVQTCALPIYEPVPGLLVGGPNPTRQDKCHYLLTDPETCYVDSDCAYASNEVAINWNAAITYLANAIEALQYEVGLSENNSSTTTTLSK